MVLISLNGQYQQRTISVLDRGFLFGESVYEVVPVYHHQPFQLDKHLARLAKGFHDLTELNVDLAKIKTWVLDYMRKVYPKPLHSVYIQLTSGIMPIRNHLPTDTQINCIIHQTHSDPIDLKVYEKGFNAITVKDTRSSHAAIKTIQLALNTQALRQAHKQGYSDAIFIRNGYVVEAASSNVFACKSQTLITPPLDGIVPGLTRQVILMLAKQENIPFEIRPIPLSELSSMDEVFLSSSIKLLKPLREIQGHYMTTSNFPMWKQLFSSYLSYIEQQLSHETTH